VRGVEHRAAARGPGAQELLDHGRRRRVEAREGLVEHEQGRARQERAGERGLLAHAAREAADRVVRPLGEAEGVEQAPGLAGEILLGDPVEAADEQQVLARREVGVERRAVGDEAQAPARLERLGGDVVAVDAHAPAVGGEQAAEDAQGRGLAGAVGPQQAQDLAAAHLEIQAVEGDELAVALRDALEGRRQIRHRRASR